MKNTYGFNVSRETLLKLEEFAELLQKKNQHLNLIAKATEEQIWDRHIMDSYQIIDLIDDKNANFIDVGSGGGFPGLVMAISGYKNLTLIDARKKKTEFLQEVAEKLQLKVKVKWIRVENYNFSKNSIITTRAFASLDKTLNLLAPNLNNIRKLYLIKGENYQKEIDEAKKTWTFKINLHISKTNSNSKILEIWDIRNVYNISS